MDHTLEFLKEQKVQEGLIRDVELFRKEYAVEETELSRVSEPDMLFYGKEVLEQPNSVSGALYARRAAQGSGVYQAEHQ